MISWPAWLPAVTQRVAVARRELPDGDTELWRWAEVFARHHRSLLLSPQGFDVIAEVKLRSPAVGRAEASGDEDIAGTGHRLCALRVRHSRVGVD